MASEASSSGTSPVSDGAGRWFQVEGSSMGAAWKDLGRVRILPRRVRRPRWGDVIVFWQGGKLKCHRVVAPPLPFFRSFLAQGDACRFTDGWIPAGSVLGTVALDPRVPDLRFPRAQWQALRSLGRVVRRRLTHADGLGD